MGRRTPGPSPARRPLPWLRIVVLSSCASRGSPTLPQQEQNRASDRACASRSPPRAGRSAPAWKPSTLEFAIRLTMPPAVATATPGSIPAAAREDTPGGRRARRGALRPLDPAHGLAETPAASMSTSCAAPPSGPRGGASGPGGMLATKFGAGSGSSDPVRRPSRPARRSASPTDAAFSFQGWLCGCSAPDEAHLACFIDGIALAGSSNPSLKAIFARAESNRTETCAPQARTASVAVKPRARP